MELPEGFGRETAVFPITFTHHSQCGGLHTSDGICAVSGGDGECLRAVDAHEPVRFAPCFGCKKEVVILASVFEVTQSFTDGLVGKRTYPEADERGGTSDIVVEVSEDKLSFAPGIGRHDDLLASVEKAGDDLDLRRHAAVGLVALLRLGLTGDEREGFGDDGQVVTDESAHTVAVRHGKLDEVSERPCHGIAASLEITFLSLCRAHDAGDFTCHTGLFCNDCLHFSCCLIVFFLLRIFWI